MEQHRKIGPVTLATGGAAAIITIIAWIVSLYGIEVPAEIQGAATVVVVLVAGYAVPPQYNGEHEA